MEIAHSSETVVTIYQITRPHLEEKLIFIITAVKISNLTKVSGGMKVHTLLIWALDGR
jgi:hypothetical protein